jgi:hypothetical protein
MPARTPRRADVLEEVVTDVELHAAEHHRSPRGFGAAPADAPSAPDTRVAQVFKKTKIAITRQMRRPATKI